MIKWIKNLFASSPAPVTEYPKILPKPLVLTDPVNIPKEVKVTKPKSTKPKATATKKAASKTASKVTAEVVSEPKKRGRKPKNEAGA